MVKAADRTIGRKFLSYRDAQTYTSLSRWTLMRAREGGELPASQIGTAVRFSVDDLDAFMRERKG